MAEKAIGVSNQQTEKSWGDPHSRTLMTDERQSDGRDGRDGTERAKRENGREIKQDLALMVDRGVFAGLGS